VLVVTGVAQFFLYRPTTEQAWGDVLQQSYGSYVRIPLALRVLHQLASRLAVLTAVAFGLVLTLRSAGGRRWVGPALGSGIAVATLLASFTGFLLPWDQLALWAVTVGSDLQGYTALFDPVVRFGLIGGVVVAKRRPPV
jgi:quinol-cytochrome oxidoreductase complex cytochrome b subunit